MNLLYKITQLMFTLWFFASGLFLFLVISFFVLLLAPVPLIPRLPFIDFLWRNFSKLVYRFCALSPMQIVDRRSEEHKLIPSKGVYIANHTCQMDVPAFLCAFTVYPIMKKQLLFLPLIGIIGWLSGALAVDRSSKSSRKRTVEKTIARLKLGVGIFFFPEGTRNKATREPKPFNEIKITLMKIAYEQNLPVTASSIYGTVDVFTPQGLLNIGTKVGIIVHHEIFPKDFASEEEFVRKAWQLVNEGYYELEKKLIDGPSSPSLETKRH